MDKKSLKLSAIASAILAIGAPAPLAQESSATSGPTTTSEYIEPPVRRAEENPSGIRIRGFAEIGYFSGNSDETAYILGDITAGIGPEAFTSDLGFGVEASALGMISEEFNRDALFLAVTYGTPYGRFSFGAPRSPVGEIIPAIPLGGIYLLDYSDGGTFGEFGFYNRELIDRIYTNRGTNPPLGLRYDARFGNFTFGASAHRFGDADYDGLTTAARYDFADSGFALMAAFEELNGTAGAPRFTSAMMGGTLELGSFYGGLLYVERDFIGLDLDGTRTWLTYRPTEAISVTGTAFNTNVEDLYGLSAQYQLPIGVYMQLGAVDGRTQEAVYDISLGWEF